MYLPRHPYLYLKQHDNMTTETPKSIDEVLKPRARLVAEMVAQRADKESVWTGYVADEELNAELRDDHKGGKFVHFSRKGNQRAVMIFWGVTLKDVKDITVNEPVPVNINVEERFRGEITVADGTTFSQRVSHTFSKTTSLSEAIKLGAEASVKATVGAEYAGISGSLELAAKITAAYEKNWGKSETTSDTVEQTITVDKAGTYEYEAVRSLDNMQRDIIATTSFSHSIAFIDERAIDGSDRDDMPRFLRYEWRSLEEFIAVAQGLATSDTALYHQFKDNKPNLEEIKSLRDSGCGTVQYTAEYDHITNQDIEIKKEV